MPEIMKHLRDENLYHEEDLDGMEGVAVERLPQVASRNFIKLLPLFDEWSLEKQGAYLLSLASSLNSALDIMQQERNAIMDTCQKQEALIEQLQNQITGLHNTFINQSSAANTAANARAEELHALRRELSVIKRGAAI